MNNFFQMELLSRELNGRNDKIDICHVKNFVKTFEKDTKEASKYIENLIVLESVLSTSQSLDNINRIVSLIRALRPGATAKQELEALVRIKYRTKIQYYCYVHCTQRVHMRFLQAFT